MIQRIASQVRREESEGAGEVREESGGVRVVRLENKATSVCIRLVLPCSLSSNTHFVFFSQITYSFNCTGGHSQTLVHGGGTVVHEGAPKPVYSRGRSTAMVRRAVESGGGGKRRREEKGRREGEERR